MRSLTVLLLLTVAAHAQDMDWGEPMDWGKPLEWDGPMPVVPAIQTEYDYGDTKITEIVRKDGSRETVTSYKIGEATIHQGKTVDCVTYGNITTCR